MPDLGERISKVTVAPTGSAIAKRQQKVATKGVYDLVEEILSIAKKSYGASLVASQMGQLAFEHTVTLCELRSRIAELQSEIRCWENVVLARASGELSEHMLKLNERQRKQTEILESLLANSDFGLPAGVLNEALPNGQALLDHHLCLLMAYCPC